jgi:DNA topoisomerase-1
VKRLRDLRGQELFQYLDDSDERQTIDSADVNAYLRDLGGDYFTTKDFRTWAGTVQCALALQQSEPADSATQAKKNVGEALKAVAQLLGNTPNICRKCYVHPIIVDAYLEGTLTDWLPRRDSNGSGDPSAPTVELSAHERAVVSVLERRWSEAA